MFVYFEHVIYQNQPTTAQEQQYLYGLVNDFVKSDISPYGYQFIVMFVGTRDGLTDAEIKINKYNTQWDRLDYLNTVMASQVQGMTVQQVDPYYITNECGSTPENPDNCPSLLDLLNTMSVEDIVAQILISTQAAEIIAALTGDGLYVDAGYIEQGYYEQ